MPFFKKKMNVKKTEEGKTKEEKELFFHKEKLDVW